MIRWVVGALAVVILAILGTFAFVYCGAFNVAADEPHSRWFLWLVENVRERSVAIRAKELSVPDLEDADLISSGGADYNEMCTGCHLKPGMSNSELRQAMYPLPPDLTRRRPRDPEETFWIIKHGIKMSGMPAWGATHDDRRMWAMVAFLRQLPRLTPEQYQILTARDEDADTQDGDASMGHAHSPSAPQSAMETHHE